MKRTHTRENVAYAGKCFSSSWRISSAILVPRMAQVALMRLCRFAGKSRVSLLISSGSRLSTHSSTVGLPVSLLVGFGPNSTFLVMVISQWLF